MTGNCHDRRARNGGQDKNPENADTRSTRTKDGNPPTTKRAIREVSKMTVSKGLMTTSAMLIATAAILGTAHSPTLAQNAAALDSAGKNGKDWLTYHGS